eukprot:SAG11_NODE_908_length_6589_cov_5.484129_6_plen_652_part_00
MVPLLLLLPATLAMRHAHQMAQFELLVTPTHHDGADAGAGATSDGSRVVLLRSVHAATSAAEALQIKHGKEAEVTVRLLPGVHTLAGRALTPGHVQRWVGELGPGGEPSILSGGASVTGWRPLTLSTSSSFLSPALPNLTHWVAQLPSGARPKSLRVGKSRAPQVTWPSASRPPERQYLYAQTVTHANASADGSPQVNVCIDEGSLPAGWRQWTNLVAYTYPGDSWVGMRVKATPNPHADMSTGQARFTLTCPDGFSGLTRGNRILFAGPPTLLGVHGTSGVWAADEEAGQVHYLSEQVPADVWVPVQSRLVTVENRSNVSFEAVTFVDVDFAASGVQTGFNRLPTDKGCPHDAVIAVSNSRDVRVRGCNFTSLASGGILLANQSTRVEISDSQFTQMGQSGVLFVGNDTSQPRECSVLRNSMRGIGTILASAGGVLITSASNITVSQNNISECARWGIAVRSNGHAQSFNNTIERNWIKRTGLRTADFGAISFIDHGAGHGNTTGNKVIGNCVRETKGMRDAFHETGHVGSISSNYFGRALYLDDHTSNVEISMNVFVDTSANAIFFHSGNYNNVQNNVFVNATQLATKKGAQLLFKEITHGSNQYPQVGNVLERNVVWSPRAVDEEGREVPMYAGRPQAVGGGAWPCAV